MAFSVAVAVAPTRSQALSVRFSSEAGCLVRKKYFVGLMTAAPICVNQRRMLSTTSLAVSCFGLVDSVESIGIRHSSIFNILSAHQATPKPLHSRVAHH